ncbi:uncharacterized protein FOMMEDRAFT_168366 [Fomitiporia mediterranea MF3/22]|uniref:uncharacterized protein n=1 Tax=Fomitiporia mediterranea (strain MF3/22) TaxID=694068 RepID=UPI00044086B3|nr:uncharacterized protein FOMMEDRAFT_168366 [Fomitiporia mediterranea MF3/22]EJD03412.1 hypothetical protein FOMMEDRAFT_168366 [Fomitiporia mediterranea MF3/22]
MAQAQPQIPQLSINGNAISSSSHSQSQVHKQATSSASTHTGAAPRPPKNTAVKTVEIDNAWGSNFWVTLIEPQSQTPFYACPATGQVSWDPPEGNFVLPPSPEGEWWELIDESRGGIPYYYHTKTNETVWERPEGFVIPLAILQNTALCRRLSVRYSQAFDPEAVKAYTEQQQQKAQQQQQNGNGNVDQDLGGRPSARRTASDNMANGYKTNDSQNVGREAAEKAMRRRSASASASAAGSSFGSTPTVRLVNSSQGTSKSGPQTPKRPHGHGHNHHLGFGGTQLPPIPGSPYQSTEGSASDAEAKVNGRAKEVQMQREKERMRQEKLREEEREREKERGRQTTSREKETAKRKSVSTGPHSRSSHRSPQTQQSLSALASRIAGDSTPPRGAGSVPPTPVSPVPPTPVSETHSSLHGGPDPEGSTMLNNMSFAPQAASSPARSASLGMGLTVSTGPSLSSKQRENVLPTPTSPVSPASLNSPFTSSLSKGKSAEKIYGAPMKSSQNQNRIPPPPILNSNATSMPAPRKSFSASSQPSIRTQDIGSPVLDTRATMNMSPVKARAEGKPILLDMKNSMDHDGTRFSTGLASFLVLLLRRSLLTGVNSSSGRPILPDELVSDIQQFMQSEFARQYFATHRSGIIFRKKIPVEKMMVWQKAPLTSPLLLMNRSLHKDAVKMFKIIQRIMGDRDRERPVVRQQSSDPHLGPTGSFTSLNASSTSLPSMVSGLLEEERWLLGEGLTHGELRDEIYCQLVKQLTGNSNPESLFRGWQLMCVLLVTFPPSKNFEAYLRSFIQQNTSKTEGRVDVMAKYCLQRLSIVSKKGPRGKPPTAAEIETASDAAFNPSTFGESLDAIIRLQERTYPHLQVPIILPFLADGILALGGMKSEGIFRIPGDGDCVSELKIRIERGYYNLEGIDDPHVPASLLKLWLRELADPLVPTELYNDCVACAKDPESCVAMVSRLPTINRRVVLFVISFLQLFLEERVQSATKMTSANLALVMAPNLLRCDSESMTVVFTNAPYEQMFVHNLLLHLKCNRVDPGYVPKHGLGAAVNNSSKPRNRRPPR